MEQRIIIFSIFFMPGVFAPVPRCSPFAFFINKLMEANSLTSDMNPYFPVPACEYGGPFQAMWAGDYDSVFVLANPGNIPRHNLYELTWIVLKGWPRLQRILAGEEEFEFDPNILLEGYRYDTRTEQIGGHGVRDTSKIDELEFDSNIMRNIAELLLEDESDDEYSSDEEDSSDEEESSDEEDSSDGEEESEAEEEDSEEEEEGTTATATTSGCPVGWTILPGGVKCFKVRDG